MLTDSLAKYFALPEESDKDLDILKWWKEHETSLGHDLGRMARQFLAIPATSAAVERLFSKAGLNHGDLRKSTHEVTLQHILMAAVNN
jgi:hypothetical protein